jgi:hypothetical protein
VAQVEEQLIFSSENPCFQTPFSKKKKKKKKEHQTVWQGLERFYFFLLSFLFFSSVTWV